MDSLDELQLLQSVFKKSKEDHKNYQNEHKALNEEIMFAEKKGNTSLSLSTTTPTETFGSSKSYEHFNELEFIQQELSKYPEINTNNETVEAIKGISQRLATEMIKFCEPMFLKKVEHLKEGMKDINSSMLRNFNRTELDKRNIHRDDSTLGLINLDSTEIGCKSGFNTSANDLSNKLLLDQIKELQEKREMEHQSYLSDKIKSDKTIEDLRMKLKKLSTQNDSEDVSVSNTSRLQGLFEWPLAEEPQSIEMTDFETNHSDNSQAYKRLLQVMSDLVKSIFDEESHIQKELETLGFSNNSNIIYRTTDEVHHGFPSFEESFQSEITFDLCEDGPDLTPSSMVYSTNQSLSINGTSSDIEDDVVLGATRKLRKTIDRLLKILFDIAKNHRYYDTEKFQDVQLELQAESQRTDKLSRQLLDKEKLVQTLENEKKDLTKKLIDYNENKSQYEKLKLKLEEYERDREQFLSESKRFQMEKSFFQKGLPQLQQSLLNEIEVLNRDIKQLEQENLNHIKKNDDLLAEMENRRSETNQLLDVKIKEKEELISQINAKEKKLTSLKRFIDEQTQEREFEREEFSKEVECLKERIKEKDKAETKLKSMINKLENHIALLNEEKANNEEQIEQLNRQNKETNIKINEQNLTIKRLEDEIERFHLIEKELQTKLQELSTAFDWKENDQIGLDNIVEWIIQFSKSNQSNNGHSLPDSSIKSNVIINEDASAVGNFDSLTDDAIFLTIRKMDDRNNTLKEEIVENKKIRNELERKNNLLKQLNDKLEQEKETLMKNIDQLTKTNELMREEINQTHLKYGELKVKLESSIDINEFKQTVESLQTKLNLEKQKFESLSTKYGQSNRHIKELNNKIEAHKNEIKTYKDLFRNFEMETKNFDTTKTKLDEAVNEMNKLNNRLENKDKEIGKLEENCEVLKSMVTSLTKEKELVYEQLKRSGDSANMRTIYEKNLDQLRLQNKALSDKLLYYELEIQNLKKKINLLEKENEQLKAENHKLMRQNNEMTVAAAVLDSSSEDENLDVNLNANNLMDRKIKNICSQNLLALKVKRLLTQKNALIYQKNYLSNILNGFQITENATFALFADLNAAHDDIGDGIVRLTAKQKFRSISYAVIATYRIRHLAKIWQCRKKLFLFNKTAMSISNNPQNLPIPPKKASSENASPVHMNGGGNVKHSWNKPINCTLKDYVDRLHVVHETLGIHTNKL